MGYYRIPEGAKYDLVKGDGAMLFGRKLNRLPGSRILLIGDINVDISLLLERPLTIGGDGFASHHEITLGGSVCNTSIVLRHFGADASILGCLGTDYFGDFALNELVRCGVCVNHVHRSEELPTSLNLIGVEPSGERTMMIHPSASRATPPSSLDRIEWSDWDWIHVSGYLLGTKLESLALSALAQSRLAHVPCSLEIPTDIATRQQHTVLGVCQDLDLLTMGHTACERLFGEIPGVSLGRELDARNVRTCLVSRGAAGCVVYRQGSFSSFPGGNFKVVDTTGAGDAALAAAIVGSLECAKPEHLGNAVNAIGGAAATIVGAGAKLLEALEPVDRV